MKNKQIRTWLAQHRLTGEKFLFDSDCDFSDAYFVFEDLQGIKHGNARLIWGMKCLTNPVFSEPQLIPPNVKLYRKRATLLQEAYNVFMLACKNDECKCKLKRSTYADAHIAVRMLELTNTGNFELAWEIFASKLTSSIRANVLSLIKNSNK